MSRRQIWKIKQIMPPTSGDEKQEEILANSTSAKQGEPQVLVSADNTSGIDVKYFSEISSEQTRSSLPAPTNTEEFHAVPGNIARLGT